MKGVWKKQRLNRETPGVRWQIPSLLHSSAKGGSSSDTHKGNRYPSVPAASEARKKEQFGRQCGTSLVPSSRRSRCYMAWTLGIVDSNLNSSRTSFRIVWMSLHWTNWYSRGKNSFFFTDVMSDSLTLIRTTHSTVFVTIRNEVFTNLGSVSLWSIPHADYLSKYRKATWSLRPQKSYILHDLHIKCVQERKAEAQEAYSQNRWFLESAGLCTHPWASKIATWCQRPNICL